MLALFPPLPQYLWSSFAGGVRNTGVRHLEAKQFVAKYDGYGGGEGVEWHRTGYFCAAGGLKNKGWTLYALRMQGQGMFETCLLVVRLYTCVLLSMQWVLLARTCLICLVQAIHCLPLTYITVTGCILHC